MSTFLSKAALSRLTDLTLSECDVRRKQLRTNLVAAAAEIVTLLRLDADSGPFPLRSPAIVLISGGQIEVRLRIIADDEAEDEGVRAKCQKMIEQFEELMLIEIKAFGAPPSTFKSLEECALLFYPARTTPGNVRQNQAPHLDQLVKNVVGILYCSNNVTATATIKKHHNVSSLHSARALRASRVALSMASRDLVGDYDAETVSNGDLKLFAANHIHMGIAPPVGTKRIVIFGTCCSKKWRAQKSEDNMQHVEAMLLEIHDGAISTRMAGAIKRSYDHNDGSVRQFTGAFATRLMQPKAFELLTAGRSEAWKNRFRADLSSCLATSGQGRTKRTRLQ
jgi:hypothetical protein